MTQTSADTGWSRVRLEMFFILLALLLAYGTYQSLGIGLGTESPVVSVTSNSMNHDPGPRTCVTDHPRYDGFTAFWHGCGAAYTQYNITKQEFKQFPLSNGFERGDILIVKGASYDEIRVGDIIVYNVPLNAIPIVHRVVAKHNGTFETKGDSNKGQNRYESRVHPDQVQGVAIGVIPWLGYIKVLPYDLYTCLLGRPTPGNRIC